MKCPQCKSQMKPDTFRKITVHECESCSGLWFDHGELEAVKDEVLPDMEWLDIDAWKDQAEFKTVMDSHTCPKCDDIVLTTVQDLNSKTEISICRQCKGTWLPAGQFLNLINVLLEQANQKSNSEYIKTSLQKSGEMLTNPDSLSSEWQELKTVFKVGIYRIFIDHPKLKSIILGLQKSMPL